MSKSVVDHGSGTPEAALSDDDLAALKDAVRGELSRHWSDATNAPSGDLRSLWDVASRQGWTSFDDPALDEAALVVQEELGRVACPLPIVDVALVNQVLVRQGRTSTADQVIAGLVRPVIGLGSIRPDGAECSHVEAAPAATHILIVDQSQECAGWFDLESSDRRELSGLPAPHWSKISTGAAPEFTVSLSDFPDLGLVRSLGLASRASAAVRRSHELAVQHAIDRRQFGKPVGAFQAVSHRLVDAEIALTATRELFAHVHSLRRNSDASWRLAAEMYLQFVGSSLASLQFDAHHTLAAIGYFEEHEAPWLFRRAHADLAVLSSLSAGTSISERLLERGESLPDFSRGAAAEAVRRDVIDAFSQWMDGPPSHVRSWDDAARDVMRDRGWIGVGWPREAGGGGWDATEVIAFSEALAYANPPLGNIMMGINSIVPMLLSVGSEQLQELVTSEVKKGDLSIALAYSEPESGSDLASLRTGAVRVDGGWLVNGQKMWGTCFPDSKWCVLAARTDAEATVPQAGISLFLVDVDSPGLTIRPHTSLGGDVSATTFWDDVFVPEDRLIGEVDKGWKALGTALAGERLLIGASVMRAHRAFDRLVALLVENPDLVVPNRRRDLHIEVTRLAVRLQCARALVQYAVHGIATGVGPQHGPSMAKVAATELAEDLNATAIALLGPDALLGASEQDGSGNGYFEDGLRASIMGVVAGGTGDIQRNLIARGIGLPRA